MCAFWRWSVAALAAGLIGFALFADGCAGDMALCEGPACRTPPAGCATDDCVAARLCQQVTCSDGTWICGCEAGAYHWAPEVGRCDDSDPCTNSDVCTAGACVGKPIACNAPPANECIDQDTLRSWTAEGACERGFCNYPSSPVSCPAGCAAGQCTGQPCLGVVCDRPPPCRAAPGTCQDGVCSYALAPAGTPCGEGGTCSASGDCELAPPPPPPRCDGTTPGECDRPHASEGDCFEGQCAGFKCDPGWADCNATWDDGCETELGTPANCGACRDTCAPAAHATATCVYGKCAGVCVAPWADCDGNLATGCETQLGSTSNCGACGDTCSAAQGTPVCTNGTCGVSGCSPPWADCDGDPANGCETQLGTVSDCSACGQSCAPAANATVSCSGGQCQIACTAPWADCDGDPANGCEAQLGTVANCGACGQSCAPAANATATCNSGSCGIACVAGWANCDGNPANGCEVQLGTISNCGGCGDTCAAAAHATATCKSGSCGIACVAPWSNCDGNQANGCEIPVGVANRCDRGGLNATTGCGTARCGSASGTDVANFGSWYCTFCVHCHLWSNGWSWCLSATGEFSPDRCASCCNATLADKVCTP